MSVEGNASSTYELKGKLSGVFSNIIDNTLSIEGAGADAKATGDAIKAHSENKNNPHGVTAAQVGARPNTWIPTAAQVGAVPVQGSYSGDMNELVTDGHYRLRTNTNLPQDARYGTCIVTRGNTSTDTVSQIVVCPFYNKIVYRDGTLSDSVWVWRDWADVYSTNNKPTPADIGALPLAGGTMTGPLTLEKPLELGSGGTGATTAVQALANLKALNLDVITDNEFIVPSGADLNTYTTPGAYRIGTATIAGSLLNAPSYKSAGGRLIVTATSSTAGCFQFILYNTVNYQVWFRVQVNNGTWGEWEQLPTSNHMPDYVVAEGTSGGWHYRKWNSGRAECWYCAVITDATAETGMTLTYGFTRWLNYPFTFKATPTVNVNVRHDTSGGIIRRVNSSTTQVGISWDARSQVNSNELFVYACGSV